MGDSKYWSLLNAGSDEFDEDGVELPYVGEDRCPRHIIREEPEWWSELFAHYDAYRNGILPNAGGLSNQPALFLPLMSLISNALGDERELAEAEKKRKDELMNRVNAKTKGRGSPNGFANISAPGRR